MSPLEPDEPSLRAIQHFGPVAQFKLWLEPTWEVIREVDHLTQCRRRVLVQEATVAKRITAQARVLRRWLVRTASSRSYARLEGT